ncbi:hypothetical protein GH714_016060 [Hevea brasiliensis]|uniref:Germin-like protein n=1 Tax=Hevea brasiliensis TaxID=3981 RepID=A0A6A6LHE4_HEVBR|nr:hypothetical protein GH714_016060 [Hevea brasiliensis]
MAMQGDPKIVSDFLIPSNMTSVDGAFFTFTGMRSLVGAEPPTAFMSVSYAVLLYPAGAPNPPHTHPRSAELLFVADGSLQVGFLDTTNKVFTQTLQAGDLFVPKGRVHFQYNADAQKPASAISAFGSANVGTVSLPNTLFTTSIDDGILAKSFKTDVATTQALKAALAPKP